MEKYSNWLAAAADKMKSESESHTTWKLIAISLKYHPNLPEDVKSEIIKLITGIHIQAHCSAYLAENAHSPDKV